MLGITNGVPPWFVLEVTVTSIQSSLGRVTGLGVKRVITTLVGFNPGISPSWGFQKPHKTRDVFDLNLINLVIFFISLNLFNLLNIELFARFAPFKRLTVLRPAQQGTRYQGVCGVSKIPYP